MVDVLARCLSVMEIEGDLRQRKANVAHLQKRPKGQSREVQDSQPSFVCGQKSWSKSSRNIFSVTWRIRLSVTARTDQPRVNHA